MKSECGEARRGGAFIQNQVSGVRMPLETEVSSEATWNIELAYRALLVVFLYICIHTSYRASCCVFMAICFQQGVEPHNFLVDAAPIEEAADPMEVDDAETQEPPAKKPKAESQ